MGKPVIWFEVMGQDADELKGFYSELFGWEIDSDNPMNYGIVSRDGNTTTDGNGIGGGIGKHPMEGQTAVTFYVAADDVAAELKRAEGLGATTVTPEMEVMEGVTIGHFADPEGNVVGIVKAPSQD